MVSTMSENEVRSYEERPHGPCCGQDYKTGGHGSLDELELLLCTNSLRDQDTSAVGSNNAFERRDHQGEWQSRLISIGTKIRVKVVVLTQDTR
jgi:hypothetical protein